MRIHSVRNTRRPLASLALVALFLLAAAPARTQGKFVAPPPIDDNPTTLQVTFLVYSGLPNPTITLRDAALVAEIQQQIANAETHGARLDGTVEEPTLGYNGILIEDAANLDSDTAIYYVIKSGVLRIEGGSYDEFTRPVRASASAAAVENQMITLGTEAGALDAAMLAVIRGGDGGDGGDGGPES